MCSNPKPVIMTEYQKIDEKTGEIYQSKRPKFLKIEEINNNTYKREEITFLPCQKCEECRIEYSSQWATRAIMEAQKWPVNAFITLTYNDDNLPEKKSLKKADLQKFWKKLRKKGYKVRYLACGEYGPTTQRPHYHAIVFNYWPSDCQIQSFNHEEDILYNSEELAKIWGKGYAIVAPVNYETCAYVARYVVKKAFGIKKQDYIKAGIEPEFLLASRRPGLGLPDERTWRNFGVPVKTKTGVKIKSLPTFTRNKMRKENREYYFKMAKKTARALKEITRTKYSATDIPYFKKTKQEHENKRLTLGKLDRRKDI